MCDCHLAELLAKAAKERDVARSDEQAAWRVVAEKAGEADRLRAELDAVRAERDAALKKVEDMAADLLEERDALRQAEAELAELRSRIEERRPGGVVRYEPEGEG